MTFLLLAEDNAAVSYHDIVMIRELNGTDLDTRTNRWRSGIHSNAKTVIAIRGGGSVYSQMPFEELMDALRMIEGVDEYGPPHD